jgi:hypothetical protein
VTLFIQFGAQRAILPPCQFGPKDTDIFRGLDTQPNLVASDLDHGERDAIADDDLFAGLSAEKQHLTPP